MKETFKKLVSNKSFSEKMSLIAAALTLIAMIVDIIYTAIYSQYADFAVVLFMVAAIGCFVAYFLLKDQPVLNWLCVLGMFFEAFAFSLFIANSLNVWQDTWGNIAQNGVVFGSFNFFNSEGGPVLPAIIILILLAAIVFGIISCFNGKEQNEGKIEVVDAQ